jgi:excisionase family DNA binding protein
MSRTEAVNTLGAEQILPRKYFTPKQVAARWHWHTESVRRMIRERRLPCVIIGRRLLVPEEELLRTESQGRIG